MQCTLVLYDYKIIKPPSQQQTKQMPRNNLIVKITPQVHENIIII